MNKGLRQDGAGDGLKMAQVFGARGHGEDADACGGLACAEVGGAKQLVQAVLQRAQMVVQQAGLKVLQQLVEGDEGEQFFGGEPQTGQVMMAVGAVVTITAAFRLVDQRGAEAVAQVGDQAGEGGTRKAVLTGECSTGKAGAPPVQQAVKAIEVVEFAQGFRVACWFFSPRIRCCWCLLCAVSVGQCGAHGKRSVLRRDRRPIQAQAGVAGILCQI